MTNYSFCEKIDMIFMYGRANGNSRKALSRIFLRPTTASNTIFTALYY